MVEPPLMIAKPNVAMCARLAAGRRLSRRRGNDLAERATSDSTSSLNRGRDDVSQGTSPIESP